MYITNPSFNVLSSHFDTEKSSEQLLDIPHLPARLPSLCIVSVPSHYSADSIMPRKAAFCVATNVHWDDDVVIITSSRIE